MKVPRFERESVGEQVWQCVGANNKISYVVCFQNAGLHGCNHARITRVNLASANAS